MNRWSVLAVLLATVAALSIRLPDLGNRPLHNDEAVNAFKVSELWQEGRYVYDPDEYHGPTLHYFSLPFLALSGTAGPNELKDSTLRLAPVAFGVGLVLLTFLFKSGMGRAATGWAVLLTVVSPAMVFYSRYFIHEILLVFFTALMLGAAWHYSQRQSTGWAILAGAGLGLMATTKETFVLTLGAAAIAGAVTAWWMIPKDRLLADIRNAWNWRHFALAAGTACVIWLTLFSSFFTNASGPIDSLRTYLPWLKRAGGESFHIHSWYFYLQRVGWFHPAKSPVWSEGLILVLALVGAVASLAGRPSALRRFLALYTLLLTAIYSAISYKTPWCLLSFFHGMILLAGVGAATLVELLQRRGLKAAMLALIGAGSLQLGWQSCRANFVFEADPRNPYVYAQTSANWLELMERVEGIARVAPAGYDTVVKVMAPDGDYWPTPWYLRRFQHVGYYEEVPKDPFSPVMLVSTDFKARFDDVSERKWIMAGIYALRSGKFFELYVELELWKQFVATLPPPEDG